MTLLNDYAEGLVFAGDGERRVLYPRLATHYLRKNIDDAHKRGMQVLAVVLYNSTTKYVYEWRRTLQTKAWLGEPLTMTRQPGEYRGTQDCIFRPGVNREYSIREMQQLLLRGG